MATHTFIEFDLPEASSLADLTGIRYDLESARAFAKELRSVHEEDKPNFNLVDALTTAVLVRYSRAFSSGVRKPLTKRAVESLSDHQRQMHERLREFRNKHIAHSVNSYEENQPIARYVKERADVEGVYSVECNHTRVVGLSSVEIGSAIDLTTALLDYVDSALKMEKQIILAKIRQTPFEELLSQGENRTSLERSVDIKKPRKA